MKAMHFTKQKSVCDKLIILLIFCFILQSLTDLFFHPFSVNNYFCFGFDNFKRGYVWTVLSYSLIHDGLFHLLANLIGIHFISRNVENTLSKNSFIFFCFLCHLFGLTLWCFFNLSNGNYILGCSALVLGSLTFFCLTRPDQPITLLLFFVVPLSLKPKVILWSTLGIELYGLIFTELKSLGGIAHSAHLGGMCAGLCFFLFHQKKLKFLVPFKFSFKHSNQQSFTKKCSKPTYRVNFSDSSLKSETDRILDKINDKGFGSLTSSEKETLEKAKKLFR